MLGLGLWWGESYESGGGGYGSVFLISSLLLLGFLYVGSVTAGSIERGVWYFETGNKWKHVSLVNRRWSFLVFLVLISAWLSKLIEGRDLISLETHIWVVCLFSSHRETESGSDASPLHSGQYAGPSSARVTEDIIYCLEFFRSCLFAKFDELCCWDSHYL